MYGSHQLNREAMEPTMYKLFIHVYTASFLLVKIPIFFLKYFSGGQTNILRNRGGRRLQLQWLKLRGRNATPNPCKCHTCTLYKSHTHIPDCISLPSCCIGGFPSCLLVHIHLYMYIHVHWYTCTCTCCVCSYMYMYMLLGK